VKRADLIDELGKRRATHRWGDIKASLMLHSNKIINPLSRRRGGGDIG